MEEWPINTVVAVCVGAQMEVRSAEGDSRAFDVKASRQ